jgi:amino-acid N-acetyltransferase
MASRETEQGFIITKPLAQDVEQISALINDFAQSTQELLPRNSNQILSHLRDFWVAVQEDTDCKRQVVACSSLYLWTERLSEIKSLAVNPKFFGKGIGKKLVEKCLQDAKDLGQEQVFALTFKPEFFYKCGFALTDKNNLPHKVWNECIHCPKLHNCGEVAVVFEL